MKLLQDAEWSHWSDREIAKQCTVGNKFVGDIRRTIVTVSEHSEPKTFTTKHGTVAKMNTAAIGKRPAPVAVEQIAPPAPWSGS